MDKYELFWSTMELCNWDNEGNDDKVLFPVIKHLSEADDETIFKFDDLMSELLYDLDTKELAKSCEEVEGCISDDGFLYSRCVALINGAKYYENAKKGKCKEMWEMEFESLLYVPQKAWALKNNADIDEYPHIAPLSYETGSNESGWK